MKITVRPMTIDDYEAVHQVDILTQRQYLGQEFDKLSTEEQNKRYLVSRKTEFQTNIDTGYCFVAETNDEIIGFLLSHETLPFHGTLYIRHIAIKPDFQGMGIGEILYRKVIDKAKGNNFKKITTLINLDNPNSIKMHKKAGFNLKDRKEAILEF